MEDDDYALSGSSFDDERYDVPQDDESVAGGDEDSAETQQAEEDSDAASALDSYSEEVIDEPEEDLKTTSSSSCITIYVRPENRITSNVMSLFEMTEYVSIRALQIERYNNCFVDTTGLDNPIDMAKRELMMRKCPLRINREMIRRVNPTTGCTEIICEEWLPAEMQFAVTYDV